MGRIVISLLLCVAPMLRADATIRYKSDVQLAPFLPPEMLDQFNKAMKSGMDAKSQVIRMKGGKAASVTGNFSSIVDFDKQEFTMLDGANKRAATVPAAKFNESWTANFTAVPEEARKVFESMKCSVETRDTGRTETIHGVQAEEHETVLTLEMPIPGGDQPMQAMRMVMHLWTAKPEEALRVQAIRELTAYNLWTNYVMNPTQGMEKIFDAMPGFGKGMKQMFDQLGARKAVMLRTDMKLYSTMFAQMAQHMLKEGETLPAGYDPDAPFITITQQVDELSTAPLDDAMFRIPEGYQVTPMGDLMKDLTKPKTLAE
jgi:hypothetical protein